MIVKRAKFQTTDEAIAAANAAKEGVRVRKEIAVIKKADLEAQKAQADALYTPKVSVHTQAKSWLNESLQMCAERKESERQLFNQIFG